MRNNLDARELVIQEMNSFRGRLCTIVESANLPKRQERALIILIKQVSYQSQAVIAELVEKLNDQDKKFSYVDQKLIEKG